MNPAIRKVLVVGGNGFIGSAVCKAALARGIEVTSVSSSGQPFRTAKGHSPAWTAKVNWQQGNALHPQSFAHLLPNVDGVVHTLGTLLEDPSYKQAFKTGNIPALLGTVLHSMTGNHGNPLQKNVDSGKPTSYESLNRDSALHVCEAFISSTYSRENGIPNKPRPFIYVSAEDIFRPVIPTRYIETKREAEKGLAELMAGNPEFRAVFMRPSLVYHAHQRPLTTPAAVLLDLSAAIHRKVPRGVPTPSSLLRSLGSVNPPSGVITTSWLESIANALTTPPIHVDHVADAICVALDSTHDVRGVVDVQRMRELVGWTEEDTQGRYGLARL